MKFYDIIRKKKFINLTGLFLILVGTLYIIMRYFILQPISFSDLSSNFIIPLIYILMGMSILIFNYLREDSATKKTISKSTAETNILRNLLYENQTAFEKIHSFKSRLNEIQEAIENMSVNSLDFSIEDKEDILEKIKLSIEKNISKTFLKEIEKKYSSLIINNNRINELRTQCSQTKQRLSLEIDALTKRGNVNLVIGIFTTFLAIGLLTFIVLTANIDNADMPTLFSHYIPRLSLTIFIEIFSFFFLKLYKSNLTDIKYFQNEMTNIESKFIALEASLIPDNYDLLKSILTDLSKTERNFILKKGESTVELEFSRIENKSIDNLIDTINNLISKLKP